MGDSLELMAAQLMANKSCVSLRFEHLYFCKNKWAFGQLSTYLEFLANQYTCCYSALSSLPSICVGTQGQEVTFLFCVSSYCATCHSLCVWSLSSSCLPSFVVISTFDRHGFYFILYHFPFLSSFKSLVVYTTRRISTLCWYHLFPISTTFSYP